ncbi:MAG: hypothetical protein Q4D38_00335 [Planctomycetia bacterium]|nr:hypothetical protein [Planctomycetia bacterium]
MSKLSTKESQELERAVDTITDLCNRGIHPNDAIIKTAKDMQLTPDRLPVLVNLYNLGATASQWESSPTLDSKVASFPIADIEKIASKMFPKVKKAEPTPHKERMWHMTPYEVFGHNPLDCYKEQPTKTAAVKSTLKPSKETLINIDRKILSTVDTIKREYSQKKTAAIHKFHQAVAEFASKFHLADFPTIKEARSELEYVYGELGVRIADHVAEKYPKVHRPKVYTKKATIKSKDHPFYVLFENIKTALEAATVANQEYEEAMEKCSAALELVRKDKEEELYPDELDKIIKTPPPVTLKKKAKVPGPADDGWSPPRRFSKLESLLTPEWVGTTGREYDILKKLHNPVHAARMRKLKIETMLTDLINTDDYLRKQDPEAVLDAYNDIVEMAPEMATKKIWVRNALRQYMATESLDFNTLGQMGQQNAQELERKSQTRKEMIDSGREFNRMLQNELDRRLDQLIRSNELKAQQKARKKEVATQLAARAKEVATQQAARAKELADQQKARVKELEQDKEFKLLQARKQREHQSFLTARQLEVNQAIEKYRSNKAPYNTELAKAKAKEDMEMARWNAQQASFPANITDADKIRQDFVTSQLHINRAENTIHTLSKKRNRTADEEKALAEAQASKAVNMSEIDLYNKQLSDATRNLRPTQTSPIQSVTNMPFK